MNEITGYTGSRAMIHCFRFQLSYTSLREVHLILPMDVPSGDYELLVAIAPIGPDKRSTIMDRVNAGVLSALADESDIDVRDFRDEGPVQ